MKALFEDDLTEEQQYDEWADRMMAAQDYEEGAYYEWSYDTELHGSFKRKELDSSQQKVQD